MKRFSRKVWLGGLLCCVLLGGWAPAPTPSAAADASLSGFAEKAFGQADSNGDGVISRSEFDAGRSKTFTEKDSNGDGFLTLAEFKADLPKIAQSRAERRFQDMDANQDGKVSRKEHEDSGDALFKRLDSNGDGRLTKDELPRPGSGKF